MTRNDLNGWMWFGASIVICIGALGELDNVLWLGLGIMLPLPWGTEE